MRISQYGLFKLPNWGIKLHYRESRERLQCEKREMNNFKKRKNRGRSQIVSRTCTFSTVTVVVFWSEWISQITLNIDCMDDHMSNYQGHKIGCYFHPTSCFLHSFGIQTMFCGGPMPAIEIDRGSWVHSWSGETMIDQACLTIGTCEIKHPWRMQGRCVARRV